MKLARRGLLAALLATGLVAACSDPQDAVGGAPAADAGADTSTEPVADAAPPETSTSIDSGLTGKCADTFGDKLTTGFGRIDGIVYAVQKPSDTECTFPNDDHVIVQVLMNGAVYRLVTNVLSNGADPKIRHAIVPHTLPPPAFAEGWHTDVTLDYPATLDAHNDDFTAFSMDDLVKEIADEVKVGDKISVYAQSGAGRPESAHLIHRNSGGQKDGAIVVGPTGSPRFLLFHFDEQVF